jgi:cytochrome c-type biogenesis protein CcmF
LWRRDPRGWLQPVLPWALFSGAILGLGILMGAAWAYEALSFGGYWAWDPVENMSLVPWLVLIAGIHTNLIAKSTDHSTRATLVFYALTFVLVLFSTFLTRSGILGDSSVHSFTEMGLEWQLVGFMLFFLGWFVWLYVARHRSMALRTDEEPLLTREFWMFIGSLILLFSAILITFTTSIPVYNKLADGAGWILGKDFSDLHRTMPLDPIEHYNKYQFWIAVLIGLLTGFTQYLRYERALTSQTGTRLLIRYSALLVSAGLFTWGTWYWLGYTGWAFHLLAFSAWFAVIANTDYLVSFLRGNLKIGAATIAHIGFGLMVVGIMASGVKKQYISQNRFAMEGILPSDIIHKNVLLFKNSPLLINGYKVTYLSDTLIGHLRTYQIQFDKLDEHGNISETFRLYPDVQFDNDFLKQAASNPSTKRYFFKDVFTHISGLPPEHSDVERAKAKEDSLRYITRYLTAGIDLDTERLSVTLGQVRRTTAHPDYEPEAGDIVVTADLLLREWDDDSTYIIHPTLVLRDNLVYNYPAKSNDLQVKARLNEALFHGFLSSTDTLKFETLILAEGEVKEWGDYRIQLRGYNREPDDARYTPQQDDISIAARIGIRPMADTGYQEEVEPIFLIRGGQPYGIPAYAPGSGLHLRFAGVNPSDATISLDVAKDPTYMGFPVDIAENYMRDDYLVLEAILFPGINFFWLGSTLMMVGLGLGAWNRRRSRTVAV